MPALTEERQDAKDDVVLPETAQKIVNGAANKESKALIQDEANHPFGVFSGDNSILERLCKESIEWLRAPFSK